MDEQQHSLIDRIKQAQNILVTVSNNPSVDQLSAAIGLTVALNKLDKHGTAVFSGQVPDTLEFLKPEDTLEKNTDSLRDFIIALDKSKADKLRYKVEDQVVRIFITPYQTSLSEKDLEFSQGDFNVDVVVALGVTQQQDLDTAISSHGRILHDATMVSVSTEGQGNLGTINWVDPKSSSLSEMMVSLIDGLDKKAMDNQIATALLTGVVATTERFSNDKTSPKTMSVAAELMAAGANQQLIATELEPEPQQLASNGQGGPQNSGGQAKDRKPEPGELDIDHEDEPDESKPAEPPKEEPQQQVHVDDDGQLIKVEEDQLPEISQVRGVSSDGKPTENHPEVHHERVVEPPQMGGDMTANASADSYDSPAEELTLPPLDGPMLSHNESVLPPENALPPDNMLPPADNAPTSFAPEEAAHDEDTHPDMPSAASPFAPPLPPPAPVNWQPPEPPAMPDPQAPPEPPQLQAMPEPPQPPVTSQPPAMPEPPTSSGPAPAAPTNPAAFDPDTTLTEIEKEVGSPHVLEEAASEPASPASPVDDARSAVEAALSQASAPSDPLEPIAALNAQPLGGDLHAEAPAPEPMPQPAPPVVTNTGFSEPTPGNTPADDALDMPLPSNPFGPGQQPSTEQFQSPQSFSIPMPQQPAPNPMQPSPSSVPPAGPPSAFPGAPQQGTTQPGGQTPPPVPPPMYPQ